jgi:hypothetical protein
MVANIRPEMEPEPQELLIHLGDKPPKVQRQALMREYVRRGILDRRVAKGMYTDDPLADIAQLRKAALADHVSEISRRLQGFDPEPYAVPGENPNFEPSKVFEQIAIRNSLYHERPSIYDRLLFTPIPEARLLEVMLYGKPGNSDSSELGDYGRQAMKEYALTDPREIMTAGEHGREDPPIFIHEGQALLAYAPDCLQRIVPRAPGFESDEDNVYAFIEPDLAYTALQAYVTREESVRFPVAADVAEPLHTVTSLRVGESALVGAGAGRPGP